MARQVSKRIPVEASSGNVFADLGLPDAEYLDKKVRLAAKINRPVAARRLNQVTAAPPVGRQSAGDRSAQDFVGAYKTRPSALRAIERLKILPGFKKSPRLRNPKTDHGDGFNINRVRLGSDNWPEGFSGEP